jgi:plastocyanin
MKKIITFGAVILASIGPLALAAEHEVGQLNKEFTVKELTVKQGDKVKFINRDPFFHNVFSLSNEMFFDLGSYPKDEFKEVVFDKKGAIEVECAIHPNMKMVVNVK